MSSRHRSPLHQSFRRFKIAFQVFKDALHIGILLQGAKLLEGHLVCTHCDNLRLYPTRGIIVLISPLSEFLYVPRNLYSFFAHD